jgi:hypothetical protein
MGPVSEEKAEVATRIVELLNRRDADGLAGLAHPDFEFYSLLASVAGAVYVAADGIREYSARSRRLGGGSF